EYVANITRTYRAALDRLACNSRFTFHTSRGRDLKLEDVKRESAVRPQERYEMEMAFSRGLYTGWLGGINNQQLVHGRFGKKRGVYLGEAKQVFRDHVMAQLEGLVKPGDGVVFDAGRPEEKEEGGRVYEVRGAKGLTE